MDPKALRYAESHEWAHLEGDVVTVGISQFAVDQLSDLIVIDLPPVGKTLVVHQDFGQVESVKNVSDLYAPVSGTVVAVNEAVAKDVQVLARSPFDEGWLVKVQVEGTADFEKLMDHDAYLAQVSAADH